MNLVLRSSLFAIALLVGMVVLLEVGRRAAGGEAGLGSRTVAATQTAGATNPVTAQALAALSTAFDLSAARVAALEDHPPRPARRKQLASRPPVAFVSTRPALRGRKKQEALVNHSMKTYHPSLIALSSLTLAAALSLTGCGTTAGYKQADKTGAGIAEFREEIINGNQAIDATMKALDQVAATANTNPRKAFEEFSKAVVKLEDAAGKVRKSSEAMKAQGAAYFKNWETQLAQVNNPEIRALAEQRKAKLQDAFEGIRKVGEPLKEQFNPWMSDLKDLQKYLSNDLTIAGVDAAKGLFTKTSQGGLEVQKSMDALIAELNTIAATITPAKVPEARK